jgi:hypothetical protein
MEIVLLVLLAWTAGRLELAEKLGRVNVDNLEPVEVEIRCLSLIHFETALFHLGICKLFEIRCVDIVCDGCLAYRFGEED